MNNPNANRSLTPASSTYQSRSTTPNNVPNAAFIGATRAFAKLPVKPKEILGSNHSGRDGALSAAKSINSTPPSRSSSDAAATPVNDNNPGVYWSRGNLGDALSRSPSTATRSTLSARPSLSVSQSASYRAATIAAARYSRSTARDSSPGLTIIPIPPGTGFEGGVGNTRHARSKSWTRDGMDNESKRQATGKSMGEERTDATPIPATTSLVKIFEQQSKIGGMRNERGTKPAIGRKPSLAKGTPPPIVSPKPQRTIPIHSVSPELQRPTPLTKPKPKPRRRTPPTNIDLSEDTSRSFEGRVATNDTGNTGSFPKPSLPPPRRTAQIISQAENSREPQEESPPLLKRPGPNKPQHNINSSQSPSRRIRRDLPFNPNQPLLSPSPYQDHALQRVSPHMTGDSLANAIVGANLAIKQRSPPKRSKTPPPVPTPRRKGHHHFSLRSRSLSPVKKTPMQLATLRPQPDEEEKEKNLKHHRFRQPNKHHEGTRGRWRDEITEAERKRYEGVWAANKGLLVQPKSLPTAADEVHSLVVRDIWSRSRLPPQKLAMIWDLVVDASDENADTGRLGREQFVVGMWLIDQSLKGRNLPNSVSPSVWGSVRMRGVEVRLKGKGRDGRKLERGPGNW
jgi:hypothetical protein